MKLTIKIILISLLFVSFAAEGSYSYAEVSAKNNSAPAAETGDVTGFPIPRFVSLRSDKAFIRSGPGTRYPIKWIYKRKNLPLEITQEYDNWRKVKDHEGAQGWIHQSLLSGRRYGVIEGQDNVEAYKNENNQDQVSMRLEPGVIAKINQCGETYCELSASGFSGWIAKKMIWGVYASERIN